jgi:hypothetical protein
MQAKQGNQQQQEWEHAGRDVRGRGYTSNSKDASKARKPTAVMRSICGEGHNIVIHLPSSFHSVSPFLSLLTSKKRRHHESTLRSFNFLYSNSLFLYRAVLTEIDLYIESRWGKNEIKRFCLN